MSHWISSEPQSLPDFIIGGAMKCGTSTLHQILNEHPKIFIPTNEIGFFDMDNIIEHSDFNFYHNKRWTTQSIEKNPTLVWDWYHDKFRDHQDFIKGEDSTTYLASPKVAERIAMQNKDIKLLFLIRQPSLRTFSNYSHLLRTGKAVTTFEGTLRSTPYRILSRSLYKQQLERYYKHIPRERIKVIVFEDLISNPALVLQEVCGFLGIDYNEFAPEAITIHANKTSVPKNQWLQIKKNRMLRNLANARYSDQLPFKASSSSSFSIWLAKVINKMHATLNPLTKSKRTINPETKRFLDDYFYTELQGLNELVGQDVLSKWFSDKTRNDMS